LYKVKKGRPRGYIIPEGGSKRREGRGAGPSIAVYQKKRRKSVTVSKNGVNTKKEF